MWFQKKDDTDKKIINSDEYEKCLSRIAELDAKYRVLQSTIDFLEGNVRLLRGKLTKAIKGGDLEVEKKPEENKTENSLNSNEVPFG